MFRRLAQAGLMATALIMVVNTAIPEAGAAGQGQPTDWNRFYYYPYMYYPQNFQQYGSYDHMYYRYAPEMQIPVYNKDWHNFYPTERPYHKGYHFHLDVF
ncbi:hypothetical protein [Rubinisphaera margarita]|uniref:hypothetical protein n=1 Tax=Rubinisphaera margarita TaxID=2909586 RepID=UPI001EE8CB13|nr:hypothetical protein [Rubinisphaera margarita]MCG6156893.1 hypothetical protein [Rubinisphaera margarita]